MGIDSCARIPTYSLEFCLAIFLVLYISFGIHPVAFYIGGIGEHFSPFSFGWCVKRELNYGSSMLSITLRLAELTLRRKVERYYFLYNDIDTPRLIYLSVERMVTYMDLGMVAMIQGI